MKKTLQIDEAAPARRQIGFGRGIGWIDAHLLASALVGRLTLWTTDPPLAMVAQQLGITYE